MLYIINNGTHSFVLSSIATELDISHLIISIEEFYDHKISSEDQYICAVGDNEKRYEIVTHHAQYNQICWATLVHPSAVIAKDCVLGVGTVVCAGVVINTEASIGNHCIINTKSSVDHHCKIFNFVHLGPGSTLCGSVTIGDRCFLGASVTVIPYITIAPLSIYKARELVKYSNGPIAIQQPCFNSNYTSHINTVLKHRAVSKKASFLSYNRKCENNLEKLLNVKRVLLVNSEATALKYLFIALKYKHPLISKIYIPNYTNKLVWNMALTIYSECNLELLPSKINTDILETNSAVVVINGEEVKYRHDIVFIEDNRYNLFSHYDLSYNLCSSLSFTVTFGIDGGAFATNDTEMANYISNIVDRDMMRLSNTDSAILYPHLLDLDRIKQKKDHIFKLYKQQLANCSTECVTNLSYWLFMIRVNECNFKTYLSDKLISCEQFTNDVIIIPSHIELDDKTITYISNCIIDFLK